MDGAAWLAFGAAMIAIIVNIVMGYIDRREARDKTLIDHRRQVLFTALEVIDHVYANEPLGGEPSRPHPWNLRHRTRPAVRMPGPCPRLSPPRSNRRPGPG